MHRDWAFGTRNNDLTPLRHYVNQGKNKAVRGPRMKENPYLTVFDIPSLPRVMGNQMYVTLRNPPFVT